LRVLARRRARRYSASRSPVVDLRPLTCDATMMRPAPARKLDGFGLLSSRVKMTGGDWLESGSARDENSRKVVSGSSFDVQKQTKIPYRGHHSGSLSLAQPYTKVVPFSPISGSYRCTVGFRGKLRHFAHRPLSVRGPDRGVGLVARPHALARGRSRVAQTSRAKLVSAYDEARARSTESAPRRTIFSSAIVRKRSDSFIAKKSAAPR
jgi:hypothetical protein